MKNKEMTRRTFLKKLGIIGGGILVGAGVIDKVFAGSAPSTEKYSKFLRENEYFVPGEVLLNYLDCISNYRIGNNVNGTYIDKNYLQYGRKDRMGNFIRELRKKGHLDKEIKNFCNLFTTFGNININQSLCKKPSLLKLVLEHERTHKEVDLLSKNDQRKIMDAYLSLRKMNHPNKGLKHFFVGNPRFPLVLSELERNPNEFPPYFINGVFGEHVELALKENFQDAYKVLYKIKQKVRSNMPLRFNKKLLLSESK